MGAFTPEPAGHALFEHLATLGLLIAISRPRQPLRTSARDWEVNSRHFAPAAGLETQTAFCPAADQPELAPQHGAEESCSADLKDSHVPGHEQGRRTNSPPRITSGEEHEASWHEGRVRPLQRTAGAQNCWCHVTRLVPPRFQSSRTTNPEIEPLTGPAASGMSDSNCRGKTCARECLPSVE